MTSQSTMLSENPVASDRHQAQRGPRESQLPSATAVIVCVAGLLLFVSDLPAWGWMYQNWMTRPDNSHGILVPLFSSWLLWHRRNQLGTQTNRSVSWSAIGVGICFILVGLAIRCAGIYTRTISTQAISVIPSIAGIFLCCGGWAVARRAWPAVLFLVFMVPLPTPIGGLLSNKLQSIATICSTFVLQTIGIPAVSEGNVIWLTEKSLGVAEACSGIRMLTSFFALAAAVGLLIQRPNWEKVTIVLSAPLIAIVANVLRISATAIAYEFGNEKMAELIFHDLAGWLMMPVGLLLLWLELFVLSKLVQETDKEQERISFGALA